MNYHGETIHEANRVIKSALRGGPLKSNTDIENKEPEFVEKIVTDINTLYNGASSEQEKKLIQFMK